MPVSHFECIRTEARISAVKPLPVLFRFDIPTTRKAFWSSKPTGRVHPAQRLHHTLRIVCNWEQTYSWDTARSHPRAEGRLIAVALQVPAERSFSFSGPPPFPSSSPPSLLLCSPLRWRWRRAGRSVAPRRHGRPELQHAPVHRGRVRAAGQPRARLARARGAAAAAPPAVQLERRPLPPGLPLGPGQVRAAVRIRASASYRAKRDHMHVAL